MAAALATPKAFELWALVWAPSSAELGRLPQWVQPVFQSGYVWFL